MFFLNLTLAQFLALFGAASGLVLALYLLDRSRRRQVVATLKFWVAAQRAPETRRQRRIQQWPSLLLQILSLGLLLAALGQLSCGQTGQAARHHVLILETSAWMGARSENGTLMERARETARACLRRWPARDRIMLVRAEALATPATGFESDRRVIERAIAESRPGATALRLEPALSLASRAQRLRGSVGEVIFVGSGRLLEEEAGSLPPVPANLRALLVSGATENCGLRQIGLRRSPEDPSVWSVFVSARNYGTMTRQRRLLLRFGGSPAGSEDLMLAPGAEQHATFSLRTRAAGWLEVRLLGADALPADDRAVLELPAFERLRVVAYTAQPGLLRPLLGANPWIQAEYRSAAEYDPAPAADLVILDRLRPPALPRAHAVWIEPPLEGGPLPVRSTVRNARLVGWRTDHPVASGIRTRDLSLRRTRVFAVGEGETAVAEVEAGPVIVARTGRWKTVVLGFHPGGPGMRYELAAPLMFANILRWMAPEIFHRWEAYALSIGSASVELGPEALGDVRVVTAEGRPVPFTREEGGLRLFSPEPGIVRILTASGERVYSMTLPQVGEVQWEPPAAARRGLPSRTEEHPPAWNLWPWLAAAGGMGLLIEWLIYGRSRSAPAATSMLGSWTLPWRRGAASARAAGNSR